ncbi:MAG: hypothetical protein AAF756_06730 [Pseudomonadota bacterium]
MSAGILLLFFVGVDNRGWHLNLGIASTLGLGVAALGPQLRARTGGALRRRPHRCVFDLLDVEHHELAQVIAWNKPLTENEMRNHDGWATVSLFPNSKRCLSCVHYSVSQAYS